ncbi:MAG: DUF1934 domain-containing protein [Clostridiales bacterium]|nr:DUF1934 domain-containing protein [Clostridiales bacterium]
MEKIACLVSVKSAFEEEEKRYEGTFEQSEERIRLSWIQPEENKGEGESRFLLSYRVEEGILRMTRQGATEMEMTFREGKVTEGIMTTSHGDFDLKMETFHIHFFPEAGEEEENIDGQDFLVKKAMLEYDLLFPNQEPMRNSMFFKVHIAK